MIEEDSINDVNSLFVDSFDSSDAECEQISLEKNQSIKAYKKTSGRLQRMKEKLTKRLKKILRHPSRLKIRKNLVVKHIDFKYEPFRVIAPIDVIRIGEAHFPLDSSFL